VRWAGKSALAGLATRCGKTTQKSVGPSDARVQALLAGAMGLSRAVGAREAIGSAGDRRGSSGFTWLKASDDVKGEETESKLSQKRLNSACRSVSPPASLGAVTRCLSLCTFSTSVFAQTFVCRRTRWWVWMVGCTGAVCVVSTATVSVAWTGAAVSTDAAWAASTGVVWVGSTETGCVGSCALLKRPE